MERKPSLITFRLFQQMITIESFIECGSWDRISGNHSGKDASSPNLYFARALHHRSIMKNRLLNELRPVQPIVTALEFGMQHICVVPIVHRKPWEKEFVVPTTGAAQYC